MSSILLRSCSARCSAARSVRSGHDHDEFLAPEPARDVFIPEQIFQAIADRPQHHVAGVVAVIVIVFLEMIDIDRKDADALTGPHRP